MTISIFLTISYMLEQLSFGLNIDFTFPADRSLDEASNADMAGEGEGRIKMLTCREGEGRVVGCHKWPKIWRRHT